MSRAAPWVLGNEMTVWRAPLAPPALDAAVTLVGAFPDNTSHEPLAFENGDRAFFVGNGDSTSDRAGLVRLPAGGALQPAVWLDAKALNFGHSVVQAADRYGFLAGYDTLVEIDATHFRVLARGLESGCRLSWDAKKACWKIDAFKKTRLVCDP